MKIEIAIPCYNEEISIAKVVHDFRAALPAAKIVVYDNHSTDQTATRANAAGADVVRVNRRGKGQVVQTAFQLTEADVLVLVDGDDTYEAGDVQKLIDPIVTGYADMTVGTRLHTDSKNFRRLHHFGNRLLTWTLNTLYRTQHHDILSGYRAFNRAFLKQVPLISDGFQIETELLIQANEFYFIVQETPIGFRDRPAGSFSKLKSFRDGYRIFLTMVVLLRDHRPLFTFTALAGLSFLVGLTAWLMGYLQPVHSVFRNAGVVIMGAAFGLQLVGLVLNTINTRMRELMSLQHRQQR